MLTVDLLSCGSQDYDVSFKPLTEEQMLKKFVLSLKELMKDKG